MKIGTINIDWFKKSKPLQGDIIAELDKQDFDFLITTENILSFKFNENHFHYHTTPIPTDREFQKLKYGIYIKGEIPLRTSIYSKHPSASQIKTIDPYTSLCHKFIVDGNQLCIYGTIIGTYGIKYQKEIAQPELDNFKTDIQHILPFNQNMVIAGDFNTSFYEEERRQLPVIQSRNEIIKFTDKKSIFRATEEIEQNIDHIFISENLKKHIQMPPSVFLADNMLKDEPHQGISLTVNFNTY
ncbi:MAG: endonuclease/exonuclease/phosphatase family protein [Chitinophagaceae bacterium]|nr:endonuclease/exonuclease/phosphatase family protein [Chitinophagaceae bacterium]